LSHLFGAEVEIACSYKYTFFHGLMLTTVLPQMEVDICSAGNLEISPVQEDMDCAR